LAGRRRGRALEALVATNDVCEVARKRVYRQKRALAQQVVMDLLQRQAVEQRVEVAGVLAIHRGVRPQGPKRLRGQLRARLERLDPVEPGRRALEHGDVAQDRSWVEVLDPVVMGTDGGGEIRRRNALCQRRGTRAQGREILLDPGGVLALLDDVPG